MTDRAPHIFTQAAFGVLRNVLQVLDNDQRGFADCFLGDFIHSLPQSTNSTLLAFAAVLTPLYSFDTCFDVSTELFASGQRGQGVDTSINTNTTVGYLLWTSFDLKAELHRIPGDNIELLSSATGSQIVEVPMPFDRQVKDDAIADRSQMQPTIERRILSNVKPSNGTADAHAPATVDRLHRLIAPPLLGSFHHVDSLPGGDLTQTSGEPTIDRINDGLEQLAFAGTLNPELINEGIDYSPVLDEHSVQLRQL